MERFRIVDDKTGTVLVETDFNPQFKVWDKAYEIIKAHPEYDVYIEVYTEKGFSHYVDAESIVADCERV